MFNLYWKKILHLPAQHMGYLLLAIDMDACIPLTRRQNVQRVIEGGCVVYILSVYQTDACNFLTRVLLLCSVCWLIHSGIDVNFRINCMISLLGKGINCMISLLAKGRTTLHLLKRA